ncbi:MAG: universal stress protein [Desulfobacteraceae bacterium]|jgi:nucleotide-binding universal stress UspA family protein
MKLLVYSNGSPASVKALQFAARLALRLDGEMAVITVRPGTHATEPPPPFGRDVNLADRAYLPSGLQILAHAWDVLCAEGLLERQEGAAVRISELSNGHLFVCQGKEGKRIPFYVCFGSMIDTLNQEIDKLRYDLLVIAPPRYGRLRNIVLGDTTRKLVLDLHASVLFVRGGDADSRFIVCADGSAACRRQSGMLRRFLPAIGPPVELVWVRTPESDAVAVEMAEHCLDRARQWMAEGGKQFKIRRLESAQPAEAICSAAGEKAVIFIGASLRHDVYRRLKGSLAIQILARTAASVLVVKGLPEDDSE